MKMTNSLENSLKWYETVFILSLECAYPLWPLLELDFSGDLRRQLINCFQETYERLLGDSPNHHEPANGYDTVGQVVVTELARFDQNNGSKTKEIMQGWVEHYYILNSGAKIEQSWMSQLLKLRNSQGDGGNEGVTLPSEFAENVMDAFEQEVLHSPFELLIASTYDHQGDSEWDRKVAKLYKDYGSPLDIFVQLIEVKRFRAYWKRLVTRLGETELRLLHDWYLQSIAQLKYAPTEMPPIEE
jgi:hypothetical protein